jgi:hypothetical protein
MKKIALLLSCLLAVTIVPAQEVVDYTNWDNVKVRTLEIYKMDNSSGKKDKINIDQLHVDSKFEKLIGKEYKKEKVYDDAVGLPAEMKINQENLSKLNHPYSKQRITIPGLDLMLPVDKRELVEFDLSTPQYHIVLENGKEIYVGMKDDELSTIFPKSWARRKLLDRQGEEYGKYSVMVLFSDVFKGETRLWDRVLILLYNPISNEVESIHTWNPS